MADEGHSEAPARGEAGTRHGPEGAPTNRSVGYRRDRLNTLTAALAAYREGLADALGVWLAGEGLGDDEQAVQRLEAARLAVAAALALGKRVCFTLETHPLLGLLAALETVQLDGRLPDWFRPRSRGKPAVTPD